jgi:nicotinamide-nucleotide amidase
MRCCIVLVGSELLQGIVPDENGPWLARRLGEAGLEVVAGLLLPDDPEAIRQVVGSWLERVDLVVVTGGLGATPDDRTRAALAAAVDRTLVLDEGALEAIRRRLASGRRRADAAVEVMALVPLGAEVLENPAGLAPGFYLEEGGRRLLALPGVPREVRALVDRHLDRLASRWPGRRPWFWRTLHVCGIPETRLARLVQEHIPSDVQVAYLPHPGWVDLRLGIPGSPEEGTRRLAPVLEELARVLGDALYGRDGESLEEVVGRELVRRSLTVAVAESLTGGAVGARLTRIPGSSRYFLGGVVAYSNASKESLLHVPATLLERHGAVSSPVARAMAEGVRRAFGADVGLSTTGIAGPTGATPTKPVGLVYVGLDGGSRPVVQRFQFSGDRAYNVSRTVTAALNLLRLHLQGRDVGDRAGGGEGARDG